MEIVLAAFRKRAEYTGSKIDVRFVKRPARAIPQEQCHPYFFKTVFVLPVEFADEIVGTLEGDARTFPVFPIVIVFGVTLIMVVSIRLFIRKRLVADLKRTIIAPIQSLARPSQATAPTGESLDLEEVENIKKDILMMNNYIAETERLKAETEKGLLLGKLAEQAWGA